MAETFFIGDTHFGHRNIIHFEEIKPFRPFATIEEHDQELVQRWNSRVRSQDIVYHLGDFCFGRENIEIAGQLKGKKRLILGNHDTYPSAAYLKYFEKLGGAITVGKEFLLTHIPVREGELSRWAYNIHGHLHTHVLPDKRYINVSCEQVNLTPISIDEVRKRICP